MMAARKNDKPPGFNELEELAKGILDGQGKSYYEWLHQQHQQIILEFNLSKIDQITELAKVGEQNG